MGFRLQANFRNPYWALNPSDFWQRWHVSLSTWLRDYLYVPLGGNRKGTYRTYRNLALTMLLGGLWHGAAWNFVIWGAYHGLLLVLYRLLDRQPEHSEPRNFARPRVLAKWALMLTLTLIGWICFRARSPAQIVYMISHLGWATTAQSVPWARDLLFFAVPLLLVEMGQYFSRDLLFLTKIHPVKRVPIYAVLAIGIMIFGVTTHGEFIYFQF